MERKELLELVKDEKASKVHPAGWFKGYTKLDVEALEALLEKCGVVVADDATETDDGTPIPEDTVIREAELEEAAGPDELAELREVAELPARVQVLKTATVNRPKGLGQRKLYAGTIFRGEWAWYLAEKHPELIKVLDA